MSLEFIPTVWASRLLKALEKSLIYGQTDVCNRDYEGEIREAGNTVKIASIGDVARTACTLSCPLCDGIEILSIAEFNKSRRGRPTRPRPLSRRSRLAGPDDRDVQAAARLQDRARRRPRTSDEARTVPAETEPP